MKHKTKPKLDYKKYSRRLEKAWRADRAEKIATINDQDASLYDWIDTAFDREDLLKKKDKKAIKLFMLGLLLGALLIESILLLAMVS